MGRRRLVSIFVVTPLIMVLAQVSHLFAATAGPQVNISNAAGQSEAPQLAVAGSTLYATWGERSTSSIAINQGTSTGSWSGITTFNTGTQTKTQWPDIAATADGTAHMVYASGNTISHRSKPAGGTWSAPRTVVTDNNPNPVRMAAAPNGTLWVIWRDNDGTTIRYRRSGDGGNTWSGGDVAAETGNMFAPDVAVGPDNVPHVVWYIRSGTDNGNTARYADWNGSGWTKGSIGGGGSYVADPVITVDKNNVQHAAYRRQSGSNWLIQHVSRSPGQVWANQTTVRTTSGDAAYAPGLATDSAGGVHITWSELNSGGGRDVWYSTKPAGKSFEAAVNVSENAGGWNNRSAIAITEDSNGIAAHIVYQRGVRGQDVDDIYYRRYLHSAPVPAISGSLTINGGATFTNQATVNAGIANTSSTAATAFSLGDGGDPGAPTQPFSNPSMNAPFTLNVGDGQCRVHTVYGRISGGQSMSALFSDSIVYDPSVQLFARAQNPNSAYNLQLNGISNALVPTGDVTYTNLQRFTLFMMAPVEECSGLKRYAIVAHGAAKPDPSSAAWKPMPADGFVSASVQFNSNAGQGSYQFDVYAEDNAGNSSAANVVAITYDTDAPTLSGAPSTLPGTQSPKTGVAYLDLSGISVNDNYYAGAGDGQRYWGMWMLVKPTSAGAPTDAEWDTYGALNRGIFTGSYQWNLAQGMVGGHQSFRPGSYTVYARYLDGAGNGSAVLQSAPLQVNQLEFFGYIPLSRR